MSIACLKDLEALQNKGGLTELILQYKIYENHFDHAEDQGAIDAAILGMKTIELRIENYVRGKRHDKEINRAGIWAADSTGIQSRV